MATKSIFKHVVIKNKVACRKLVTALENAETARRVMDAPINKKVITVPKEKTKDFFEKL